MNILVNGLGNIGTTLANLCLDFKDDLSIDNVYVYKNVPETWLDEDLEFLREKGAIICTSNKYSFTEIAKHIHYIFECRDHAVVQTTPNCYQAFTNLKGIVAQGSESDFGTPIMIGVNSELAHCQLRTHVVSCNSHGITSVMQACTGSQLDNLTDADVVVVRRSEDLSSSKKLVGSNVVIRHCDSEHGTHHATDVRALFQTLHIQCPLSTSDINTPSQLMHAIRFNIELKHPVTMNDIQTLIEHNPFCATTEKFDSNKLFELGRRYGVQGRIYSHAVICTTSLMLQGNRIKGWAFIPQEGNSILSTLESYLQQTDHPDRQNVIESLKAKLLKARW
ncbi:MAG: hypothetical protein WCK01_01495 [Candidatus Uhrbacteria bacterium]